MADMWCAPDKMDRGLPFGVAAYRLAFDEIRKPNDDDAIDVRCEVMMMMIANLPAICATVLCIILALRTIRNMQTLYSI